jgi:hypothetical protein
MTQVLKELMIKCKDKNKSRRTNITVNNGSGWMTSVLTCSQMGTAYWQSGSSGRVTAEQVWGPEFKP